MTTYKDHNIYIFDYDFDMHKLNENMLAFKHKFEAYSDYRGTLDWWSVAREIEFDYATDLCETFDIKATPTIYLNAKKYDGDLTYEALKLKIESLLK